MAYQTPGDAGAVRGRFGVSRPTWRKGRRRYEADGEAVLREQSRRPHWSPALADPVQQARILDLRRERRLGVKRLRKELPRLHAMRLSAATIH